MLQGIAVPEKNRYGTGILFLPQKEDEAAICMSIVKNTIQNESLTILAIRDVPVNTDILGVVSRTNEPGIKQIFVSGCNDQETLERKLFIARKKIENAVMNTDLSQKRDF